MFSVDTENLHPSTLLCLEAIQFLHESEDFGNILDIGCGDGVLSIVAGHVWQEAQILACDIAQKATKDAKMYVSMQQKCAKIDVIRSDAFSNPLIFKRAPYDLILCNLLAELLLENAHNIKKNLDKNGIAVLSGILEWKCAELEALFTGLNIRIIKKIQQSPWICLVLRNTTET